MVLSVWLIILVLRVFLWQTQETENFLFPACMSCLSLYVPIQLTVRAIWNTYLSESITVLNVLFTSRNQQRSFLNFSLNQCFTNRQFQQNKKKLNTLYRRQNYTYLFISSSQHKQWANTFLLTSIYFPEIFQFHKSLMFFFSTSLEKQNNKAAWLALAVEIAFLTQKLHRLK